MGKNHASCGNLRCRSEFAGSYVEACSSVRACVSATVHLARHASHAEVGRVLSGRSEIALSGAGRVEAARLADRLAGEPLVAIHASPRRRARETAEIVAERHGLPVEIAPAMDEIDFGAWSGKAFDALDADPAWMEWNSARGRAATPAGETMEAAAARAVDAIEGIAREGETVLCVSHCDVIRAVAARYLGLSYDHVLAFDCDPASLTTLALHGGGGRVVTLNERAGVAA